MTEKVIKLKGADGANYEVSGNKIGSGAKKDVYANADKKYVADFICYNEIIVELKALNHITNDHHAQVINYLKATSYPVGLLINFGERSLYHKRLILY